MARDWSLSVMLAELHDDIERRLATSRRALRHSGTLGDASEGVWLELLNLYLPGRYQALKAHVVDSKDEISHQIDIVIRDRQYSPFIFHYQDQAIVPAESVYAVFEAKQSIDADTIRYAQEKAESVRRLHRTSLPIPHAGGTYPPKPLSPILAGILTLESEWRPPLGNPLLTALAAERDADHRLDLGCIAAHGIFVRKDGGSYDVRAGRKPATAFLLELIAHLQTQATVPMVDVRAYADWLT